MKVNFMSKRIALLNYEDVNGIAADSKSMQVYSLLEDDPQYEINELDKEVYDYQNNLQVIHNAESDSRALEQTVNILQGSQITQNSALEAISILSNHIAKRNGLIVKTSRVSTESIIEGVSSAIKNIIEAISKTITRVVEWISDVFKRLFGATDKLENKQEVLQKEAKQVEKISKDKSVEKGTDGAGKAEEKPKMICRFDKSAIQSSGGKYLSEGKLLELGDPSHLVSDFAGTLEDIASVSFTSEKDFLEGSKLHKSYDNLEKIVQDGDAALPGELRVATDVNTGSLFTFKRGGKDYHSLKVNADFFNGVHEIDVFSTGSAITLLAKTAKYVNDSWKTTLRRMTERCEKALSKLKVQIIYISSKGGNFLRDGKITESDLKKTLDVYKDTIKLAQMQLQSIVAYTTTIFRIVAEYQRMIGASFKAINKL